jgi:hypothetical protein
MNEKNLAYLKDNVKYLGFGEKLFTDLENNLNQGKNEFTLNINTIFNRDTISATLHFRKSENTDMYFLNNYDASLEKSGKESISQTIYLDNGKGITMKEAYNLLEGRAVLKELNNKGGEKYQAWLQLDFKEKDQHENFKMKQFHENYGYDLKGQVQNLVLSNPAPEMEQQLIKSLQKGNIQSAVVMDKNDKEVKVFIEANPQYKTLNIYDTEMKLLPREQKSDLLINPALQSAKTQNEVGLEKTDGQAKTETIGVKSQSSEQTSTYRQTVEKNNSKQKNNMEQDAVSSGETKRKSTRKVKDLIEQKQGAANTKGLRR